jgi:hypothetical protein
MLKNHLNLKSGNVLFLSDIILGSGLLIIITMGYLIYFIAFACLAVGSTIQPPYNNSSAAAKVTANSSIAANSSVDINSTYLEIQFWAEPGCKGNLTNIYKDITSYYGGEAMNYGARPYFSFKINRPLRGREQLDFSTSASGAPIKNSTDWCEVFLHSYWPWTSPGKGSNEHTDIYVNINSGMC